MPKYYVYLVASHRNGALDCGVAANLVHKVWQHRAGRIEGSGDMLVWYEEHLDMRTTLRRQTQIARAPEAWRRQLVADANPFWTDLYDTLLAPPPRVSEAA